MSKVETTIEPTADEAFDLTASHEFSSSTPNGHEGGGQGDNNLLMQAQRSYTIDVVASRYTIQLDKPLEHLSSGFAKAYQVMDKRSPDALRYALILDSNIPMRAQTIYALKGQSIPGLITPLDIEIVQLSTTKSWHAVVVLDIPQGTKLSAFLQQNGSLSEHFLVEKIIPSFVRVLKILHELGIGHGNINTEKVYIDSNHQIIIDECISEPPGYSQPILFEPFERMLMQPIGKGEADCSADFYALGVLCLMCAAIKIPATVLDEDSLLHARLSRGSFNAIAADILRPGAMRDFFQGTMADLKSERWNERQIQEWLKGRKISISSMAYFEHASRSIVFNDTSHNSPRSLAYDLSHNWNLAGKFVRDPKLLAWLERSVSEELMAERINLTLQMVGARGPMAVTEDELLTHILLALNPQGPVVYRETRIHFEGIGTTLAYAFQKNRRDQFFHLSKIISANLTYVSEAFHPSAEEPAILPEEKADTGNWSLDKLKSFMERTEPGYGLERCLYELNPMLPCQSPTVINDYVLQVPDLLAALDHAAEKGNAKLVDRHIAAFILNRLGKLNESNLRTFQTFPKFGENAAIRALSILSAAERAVRSRPLLNLAKAMTRHLNSYIQLFHSRSIRVEIQKRLDVSVAEGSLARIFDAVSDFNLLKKDHIGFDEARSKYKILQLQIDQSSDDKRLYEIGYRQGLRIAVLLSFLVSGLVVLWIMIGYLRSTI